jgi:nucleoside-diphosphate-sugar epimerase
LRAAGAKRLIAQSIAWAYAPKTPPYVESDALDAQASGARGLTVGQGVIPLENAVLDQPDFVGVVLRYGYLYGPGTWSGATPQGPSCVHVDAAAHAALLALDRGKGAYNIAEPGGEAAADKAIAELGWRDEFRADA